MCYNEFVEKTFSGGELMNKSDSNTITDVANEAMELNRKLINVMLNHSMKESEIFVQHYETQLKMKTQFLADLEDEEPPKFFKSAHRDWDQRKEKLESEIDEISKKLYEEYCEIGKTLEVLSEN